MTFRKTSYVVFSLLLLNSACQKAVDESLLARVNGEAIDASEFRLRLAEYRMGATPRMGPTPEELMVKRRVLNELIEEKLLLQEARTLKMEISPRDVEGKIEEVERDYPKGTLEEELKQERISPSRFKDRIRNSLLLEKLLKAVTQKVPRPKPEKIQKYYNEHPEEFQTQNQMHVQQIVVKTEEDAKHIVEELKKGASFEGLARSHSFTPDAAQGGDLGFVSLDSMPKEATEELAKLKIGTPSKAVSSDYGFHIFLVLERKPGRQIPLEEASPKIAQTLTQKDRQETFSNWRKEVLSKAKIERNHALLASIP